MENAYDDPEFFRQYRALRLTDSGINGLIEEPAIRARIGSPSGLVVLDIGCGFGQQARWLAENGAVRVVGIDPSQRMIEAARELSPHPCIEYRCGYAEDLGPDTTFDLIVSSMALHYVRDLKGLFEKVALLLRPGGRFVFSIEHPICTANPNGYGEDGLGKFWRLSQYFDDGLRRQHWLVDGVEKYHRTLGQLTGTLLALGFRLLALDEPQPIQSSAAKTHPQHDYFNLRPSILVIAADRQN